MPKRSKSQGLGSPKAVGVDLKAICSIDHECIGCSDITKTCCAKYDVCVHEEGLDKILPYLPEAAELCPHLKTEEGYANIFEETEDGLYSIDTHDDGLCGFAYRKEGLIRCSLHSIEIKLGLPLGAIKPEVCILWPLTFTGDGKTLTLHDDALGCECSQPRKELSRTISPALQGTIRHFGGEIPNQLS